MNKDFDVSYKERYTANNVIDRGYEIYDEWNSNGFSSQKIVSYAESAVSNSQTKRTPAACAEALSCLFALDMRIKEKYSTFFGCLLSYLPWRRETKALALLRSVFKFSSGENDIRTAIEIELKQLREKIEAGEFDDEDNNTGGGKRNGKADEEALAAEEKGKEQGAEEKGEEAADAEEAKEETTEEAEEKTEDISKQTPEEEPTKDNLEKQENAELPQEEAEKAAQDGKEQQKTEEKSEPKKENNGPDTKSEPSKDTPKEDAPYNDAVYPPLFYEAAQGNNPTDEKTSVIDEVILDNIAKGNGDSVADDASEKVSADKETNRLADATQRGAEESKSTEKNADLYDKTLKNEKDTTAQNTDKAETEKAEVKQDQTQKSENAETANKEKENVRVPIQVDINAKYENEMRIELSMDMSSEVVEAIMQAQADYMREQLDIIGADLGMDAPVQIAQKAEEPPAKQTMAAPSIK